MDYQEQVETMLAHMAQEHSNVEVLALIQALGQGIAKAACLLPTQEFRVEVLSKAFVAIDKEAQILQAQFQMVSARGMSKMTVPVFVDSLRRRGGRLNG